MRLLLLGATFEGEPPSAPAPTRTSACVTNSLHHFASFVDSDRGTTLRSGSGTTQGKVVAHKAWLAATLGLRLCTTDRSCTQ